MRLVCIIIVLLYACSAFAQQSYQVGLLPSVNISGKLPADYKLNFKVQSRQVLKSADFGMDASPGYKYVLTDMALVTSKKVDYNKTLALGYLIRLREGDIYHRLIQQFAITSQYSGLRLSHRISSDQTFTRDNVPEFRIRYRISTEVALSGQTVDAREFYFKVNNEYLGSFEKGDEDLEIRVAPAFGYKFTDNNKLEWGLDYRISLFIRDDSRHSFWASLSWYQSFGK